MKRRGWLVPDDADIRTAWLARVLGVRLQAAGETAPIGEPDPEEMPVTDRLRAAGEWLRDLRATSAPETADLLTRYAAAVATAKTDPERVLPVLDELEADIALARSAARARETAPPPGRGVVYQKLLLRWRAAQDALDANLQKLGETLLARDDVKADPRIEDVRRAVAILPKLVPAFGGKLEDALDAAMSASDPAERAQHEAEGSAAIDAYRLQLAGAKPLLELEAFAASDLGMALPLHAALDQALAELKAQLAA